MSNEADEISKAMQQIIGGASSAAVMAQYITAYDEFATRAMEGLILTNVVADVDALARASWEIADAMMMERRKRGIGGLGPKEETP